jgi:hypothetical protein
VLLALGFFRVFCLSFSTLALFIVVTAAKEQLTKKAGLKLNCSHPTQRIPVLAIVLR